MGSVHLTMAGTQPTLDFHAGQPPLHCDCWSCVHLPDGTPRSPNTDPGYADHFGDAHCEACGDTISGTAEACDCGAVTREPDRLCAACETYYRPAPGAPCRCGRRAR